MKKTHLKVDASGFREYQNKISSTETVTSFSVIPPSILNKLISIPFICSAISYSLYGFQKRFKRQNLIEKNKEKIKYSYMILRMITYFNQIIEIYTNISNT
ncbi:hypothetical protein YYE_04423 [Plasmodium vinckei vinckei]|uniref:CIR protein PIR protein n=1 Tax=Plasmodium vinckei vinckei TaxID=54757 RepID=A0A081IA86_PLAVN|nr:hypothetical protein YYE_04423 [Plasmodium vinckei vinckei]